MLQTPNRCAVNGLQDGTESIRITVHELVRKKRCRDDNELFLFLGRRISASKHEWAAIERVGAHEARVIVEQRQKLRGRNGKRNRAVNKVSRIRALEIWN